MVQSIFIEPARRFGSTGMLWRHGADRRRKSRRRLVQKQAEHHFDSMVSHRGLTTVYIFGLGLRGPHYCRHHGGTVTAVNLEDQSGVAFVMRHRSWCLRVNPLLSTMMTHFGQALKSARAQHSSI